MKKIILKSAAAISLLLVYVFTLTVGDASALEYKIVEIIERDTTGDGIKEKLKILGDEKSSGYFIDVVHGDGKAYRLKAHKKFHSLGHYTTFYSLKTIIADINEDNVPEIVTMGSGTHEVPIHVFRWDGSGYNLVFSTWTYSSMNFKDITGDDIPELIVHRRLYGTGEEDIYYQWKDGGYRKIYYEMGAARGFDRLRDVLMMIQNDAFPHKEDIPDRHQLLKNYFTDEWVINKDNMKYLEQWNKDLLSIQITEFLAIDEKMDPDYPGRVIEEKWRFRVKTLRTKDSRLYSETLIMEVDIKPVKSLGEIKWRINNIKFRQM